MSSEYQLIATLALIDKCLHEIVGPLLVSVGTVSCILSLAVFTKKTLRKNPCSIYYIAYNLTNLLFISTVILPRILARGYLIDPTPYNVILCRMRQYTTLLFEVLAPSYLILASVDRVLLTSRSATTRQRSTPRLAYICITLVAVFWLVAQCHTLLLSEIAVPAPGIQLCFFRFDGYYVFITYYKVIVKGLLVPLLMLIFGLWTVKNVREVGRVAAAPVCHTTSNGRSGVHQLRSLPSKDHQLLRIVLVDVIVYLAFSLMTSTVVTYQLIVPDRKQGTTDTQIRTFYVVFGAFCAYVPACIGFYNNLLVSKTFRREVKDVLLCK